MSESSDERSDHEQDAADALTNVTARATADGDEAVDDGDANALDWSVVLADSGPDATEATAAAPINNAGVANDISDPFARAVEVAAASARALGEGKAQLAMATWKLIPKESQYFRFVAKDGLPLIHDAWRKQRADSFVTKVAYRILYDLWIPPVVDAIQYMDLVFAALEVYRDNVHTQIHVLHLLRHTITSQGHHAAIVEMGGRARVCEALQAHPTDRRLQKSGLSLLGALLNRTNNVPWNDAEACVPTIVAALAAFNTDVDLLVSAIHPLLHLRNFAANTKQDPLFTKAVMACGGFHTTLSLMRAMPDSGEIQRGGAALLSSCYPGYGLIDPAAEALVTEGGGWETVRAAMQTHRLKPSVQHGACFCILRWGRNEALARFMLPNGVIACLLDVLVCHADNKHVVQAARDAIRRLAQHPESRTPEALNELLATMKLRRQRAEQFAGCQILLSLLRHKATDDRVDVNTAGNIIEALVAAANNHPNDIDIVGTACGALGIVASYPSMQEAIGGDVSRAALQAACRFPEHASLQRSCLIVLDKAVRIDNTPTDNPDDPHPPVPATRRELSRLALSALASHPSHASLQRYGCGLLAACMTDAQGGAPEDNMVVDGEVVGALVAAMRAHPTSFRVQHAGITGILEVITTRMLLDREQVAVEGGAVEALIGSMRACAGDMRLARLAVHTLSTFYSGVPSDPEVSQRLLDCDGIDVVLGSLRTHSEEPRVLLHGAKTISKFIFHINEEGRAVARQMRQGPTVEVLLQTMRHKATAYYSRRIVEHCAATISFLHDDRKVQT